MVSVKIYRSAIATGFDEHVYTDASGLIDVRTSAEKAPILNSMYNEATRASAEIVADDFLISLISTQSYFLGGVSHYDLLIFDDDIILFRGVIPLDSLSYNYKEKIMNITAYTYEYLFKVLEQAVSPTSCLSLDLYLSSLTTKLRTTFLRGNIINFPELMSANNKYEEVKIINDIDDSSLYIDSVVDAGMISKHHTVRDSNWNVIDEWDYYEYRKISWRVVQRLNKYKIVRKIAVYNIYNNVCVEEVENSTEYLPTEYSVLQDVMHPLLPIVIKPGAVSSIPSLKEDIPEYYEDTSWINIFFSRYVYWSGDLYFHGFLLPTLPIFKTGTTFTKMMKVYFLLHNLSFRFDSGGYMDNGYLESGTLTVVRNNLPEYTYLDVTNRLVEMEVSSLAYLSVDLSDIDNLLGDSSIIKAFLEDKYTTGIERINQYSLTVDDISNDDIHKLDVILADGVAIKVMELQKDIANDEYKIIAWGV